MLSCLARLTRRRRLRSEFLICAANRVLAFLASVRWSLRRLTSRSSSDADCSNRDVKCWIPWSDCERASVTVGVLPHLPVG